MNDRTSQLIARLSIVAILGLFQQASAQSTKPQTPADFVVEANNTLGFDFYQKLAADPAMSRKNLLFSPYSTSTAFSMLMEGARGETARQLAAALHLSSNLSTPHDGALAIRKHFAESTAKEGFELFSANGIWIDRGFSLNSAFIQSLDQIYGIQGPTTLDLNANPQAARQQINAWADQQTHGKIKEIMPAQIPPATAMVLANTVYLKATWFKPFERKATTTKPFHVDRDSVHDVSVPMMSEWTDDSNPYMETDDFQMTLLWYGYRKQEGNALNAVVPAFMLIVLPKRVDGLADVEKSLTWRKLDQLTDSFGKAEVHVELPKFKMSSELDLKKMLDQLGAHDAFDPAKADLSGIAPASVGKSLYVSTATHRAVIDVNEEGTEASADSMMMAAGGIPPKRAEFIADHPFLFYIIHRETNAILFMGRVVNLAQ